MGVAVFSKQLKTEGYRRRLPQITKESIATLFISVRCTKGVDLLSLDIEPNSYYALEGLKGFRPRFVVVEYNASITPDIEWKISYDADRT
jgi:hypothetical protein